MPDCFRVRPASWLRVRASLVDASPLVALTIGVLLFWFLRLAYWSATAETPFSDMANFDNTAHGIASSWNFQWDGFWRTYTTPTLVTARAFQIVLFGDGLRAWQLFQATLTCAALLWLVREVRLATGSRGLGVALLAFVAISQSSVFWSLKLSREGFHEMLTYLTAAAVLFAIRKDRWEAYALCGAVMAMNFLNRPNSILLVPPLVLMVFLGRLREQPRQQAERSLSSAARLCRPVAAFLLGVGLLWGPWIIRSVRIYGEPVLLNTQGPYGLLWERGRVRVVLPDGRAVVTDATELQREATTRFRTDLEASRYAGTVAWAWIRQERKALPRLVWRNIRRTIDDGTISLTTVSRSRLFAGPLNYILLDKRPALVYGGVAGLAALAVLYPGRLLVLWLASVVPWLSAAMLLGEPRMLDSALPLVLFGNVAWVIVLWRVVRRNERAALAIGRGSRMLSQ